MSELPFSIPDRAHNVLVLAPSEAQSLCTELSREDDPGSIRNLTITYLEDADACRRRWQTNRGSLPEELVVIQAGERRSASRQRSADDSVAAAQEHPGDLTWLGIHANEHLTRWFDVDDEVVICLDSLSVMLQYVETERAYKFVHVLSNRAEQAGALAHYHMDPTVHDDQTVNLLKQLCDAAVEFDPGTEEWSITTR